MNTATEKNPIEHEFTIKCLVDPFWIDYLTKEIDIFGGQYIGYWAYGVEQDNQLGWLVYEHGDGDRASDIECKRVVKLWRAGKKLPAFWHRIHSAAAFRAWEEGVKRWGVDWYEQTDSTREDVVIQLALLNEVRYG